MSSRMLYNRPLPVNRIVNAIADSRSSCSPVLPQLTHRLASSHYRGTGQHSTLRTETLWSGILGCGLRCVFASPSCLNLAVSLTLSLSPARRRKVLTYTSSPPRATASSTTPCPSVPALNPPRRTSRLTTTSSPIVSSCENPGRVTSRTLTLSLPLPLFYLSLPLLSPPLSLSLKRTGDLPTLIKHGLHALRDTLQQDKELTPANTSIGIVGLASPNSSSSAPTSTDPEAPTPVGSAAGQGFQKFRIVEGEDLQVYLDSMDPKEVLGVEDGAVAPPAAPSAPDAPPPATGGDSMETD